MSNELESIIYLYYFNNKRSKHFNQCIIQTTYICICIDICICIHTQGESTNNLPQKISSLLLCNCALGDGDLKGRFI